jgi:hypothetical protein
MHINPYYLPLGPVIGLNEAQHQRTASFHSDMFLPMLRFLGECDYGKPSTPYLFYIEAQIPKCPLPSMPMQTWPIPQQPIRIQDITPSTVLGESACLKNLRTYAAYTIRKSPPRYVKTGEWKTWARANIIEESWAQAQDDVIKQIKALGDSWRSLGEKKKAVTHYIQGQITALIDKSVSTERHGALDWSLVRLDTLFKPVSLNNGNGGRSYTVRKVSSLDFHKDTSSDSGTSREIAKLPEPDTLKTSHIQNSWRGYGTPTYELKLNELLKEQLGLELKLKELLKAPEQPRIKRLELHARFKAFERCLNPQLGPKNASTLEGSQPEYIFLVPFWTESRPLQIESRMETRTKVEVFGAGFLRTVRELIFDCSKAERREIRAMPDIVFSILFVEDEADQVENAMSHFPYFSPLGFATVKNYFPYGSEKSCPKYFNLGSGRQEHRGWNCAALYHPFEEPFSDIVYASRHGHQCWTVDEGPNILSEYVWEWFWSCCHCGFHLNMSTFIEQCPGCIRPSCNTHSGTTKRSKQSYMRRNNVTRNPM